VADRTDFYFRQRVTESELDLAFSLLEQADRNLASDLGVFGIIAGAVPAPHAPVPDLTVDLTAATSAYDRLGQRIFFGTGQRVDCTLDASGVPTDVAGQGNERWLAIFLRFGRRLSDPRTDGNSQQVYFRRDESFELVVRQGLEAAAGAAVPVALQDGELLLCDVRRAYGRAQILVGDLDLRRRQAFVFARASAVQVNPGPWKILAPTAPHAQATLDAVDDVLAAHLAGTGRRHPADAIDFTPHGFLASKTVGAALAELVDTLVAVSGTPGTARIGADALPGTPAALPPGSVRGQLGQLLAVLNAHLSASKEAHTASAIAAAPFGPVKSANVQAQLQELLTLLAAVGGATLVGADAAPGKPFALPQGTLRDQLVATLAQLNQFVADLAAVAAGVGAARVGNEALAGAPKAHAAASLHDQLQGLCDDVNAHIASGDHDARYPRLTYSNGQLYNPGQTIAHGDIHGWPAIITAYYSTAFVSPTMPLGPFFAQGPLSSQVVTSVAKANNGVFDLSIQNTTAQPLYILVNVYRVGV
jgi:hypothetical protein